MVQINYFASELEQKVIRDTISEFKQPVLDQINGGEKVSSADIFDFLVQSFISELSIMIKGDE